MGAGAIGRDGLVDAIAAELTATVDAIAPAAPSITLGPSGSTSDPQPAFVQR